MKREYNYMTFTPEEVEAGLFQKLVDFFMFYNKTAKEHYIDFHITTDGYCTIVEWDEVPYNHQWGGQFKYVGFDGHVMHEVELPGGQCVLSENEQEDREIIESYMHDNPGYTYDWVYQTWKHND